MKQVWERLRSELVDIIEWSDAVPGAPSPAGDTLAWRFAAGGEPGRSRTIRNGAQLIVREGQRAVFLDEGRIADAFGPGRHTLSTANLPLLTNLLCLPTGFESPFKAEVVFVATRLFSDCKWGTRQPLLLRDPELGPVRLRGFGSYSLRVSDPAWLVREVTGASSRVDLSALQDPLRSLIVSRLADVLGRCGCPVFDLAGRSETLARDLRLALLEDAGQLGLEIPSLLIEGLTLPPEVEAALVRRSVRRVEGEPAAAGPASLSGDADVSASPRPGAEASAPAVPTSASTASQPGAVRPRSAAGADASLPAANPPATRATPPADSNARDRPRPRRAPPPPPPLPGLTRPSPLAETAAPAPAEPRQPTADTAAEPAERLDLPLACVRSTGSGATTTTADPTQGAEPGAKGGTPEAMA